MITFAAIRSLGYFSQKLRHVAFSLLAVTKCTLNVTILVLIRKQTRIAMPFKVHNLQADALKTRVNYAEFLKIITSY